MHPLAKVTLGLAATGAATLAVSITGYSTQTTAAGVNGSGGTAGEVLTNNGDGTADWAALPVFRARVDGATGEALLGNLATSRLVVGIYHVTANRSLADCATTVTAATAGVSRGAGGSAAGCGRVFTGAVCRGWVDGLGRGFCTFGVCTG